MISGVSERTLSGPDGAAVAVLTPHGELDLASIASLDSAVRSVLRTAGPQPKLIVDLSDVSLLQPVVLGVLLDARRRCRQAGGAIALVVTAPEVSTTLAETDIAPLFDTAPGLHAAVQRVCGSLNR